MMLTATPAPAKYIGVRVSSRAKNPGENTLISTNDGRPAANGSQRSRARLCIFRSELAALEQHLNDRKRNGHQGDCRRNGQHHRQIDGTVLRHVNAITITGSQVA